MIRAVHRALPWCPLDPDPFAVLVVWLVSRLELCKIIIQTIRGLDVRPTQHRRSCIIFADREPVTICLDVYQGTILLSINGATSVYNI